MQNVNTARFLGKKGALVHNEKPQIHRSLKNSNNTLMYIAFANNNYSK